MTSGPPSTPRRRLREGSTVPPALPAPGICHQGHKTFSVSKASRLKTSLNVKIPSLYNPLCPIDAALQTPGDILSCHGSHSKGNRRPQQGAGSGARRKDPVSRPLVQTCFTQLPRPPQASQTVRDPEQHVSASRSPAL